MRLTRILFHTFSIALSLFLLVPTAFAVTVGDFSLDRTEVSLSEPLIALSSSISKSIKPIFLDLGESNIDPPLNTIEAEITDPNFNVMRNNSTDRGKAVAWVVGCLVVGTLVPVITWWAFSR